ncbi:MAG: SPOR domain-containing protein [Marinilabiliaceae bacterium]|nr:SPOR domain-containing protein [Marinilabiliaceae bacterium]
MRVYIILLLFILLPVVVEGQAKGSVQVEYSSLKLDSLINYNVKSNYNQTTLDGFRIQIYSGSGVSAKQEAQAAQSKFLELFPLEKAIVIYSAPFWRVRIGDYRYRSEALSLLNRVKKQFPGAYTVRDNTIRKRSFK